MNGTFVTPCALNLSHCRRPWLSSLAAFFGLAAAANAALILDLPDLTLQPNMPGQSFTIGVQNTGGSMALNGVQLELIIGNGDTAIGGSGGAPAFQAVTLITPTLLFGSNNNGDGGAGNYAADFPPNGLKQLFQRATSTAPSTTVTLGNGTFDLATVTFDTTGISPGNYSWAATWTIPNIGTATSYFTDMNGQLFPTLSEGTLSVVPEPVNVALTIFGALAALIGGLRRCYARK